MYRKLHHLLLMWVLLLGFAKGRVNFRKFRKREGLTDVSITSGYSTMRSTRSKIQCAAACEEEVDCQRYSYENKVCKMGDSASGPDVMFKVYDNCPAERGYSLWVYGDMRMCLKYHSSSMNHTDAQTTCVRDGGHLVLVESQAVRERINETPTALEVTSAVWLDGFDQNSTNLFLTWKGEPLAWIEWALANPDDNGGDDCLVGKSKDGYKHRDHKCSDDINTLCQIDII